MAGAIKSATVDNAATVPRTVHTQQNVYLICFDFTTPQRCGPEKKRKIESMAFMKRLAFLAVLSLVAAQAQVPPEEKKPSVAGSVLSTTGDPLKKAQITLRRADGRGEGGYAASSDASGAFRFADLAPGKYVLYVQRNGYISQQHSSLGRASSTFTLASGQQLTGLVVKLAPHGVISGKVTDEDGDPVAQCAVQVLTQRYVRGKRQYQPAGGAQVNDLGEFRVANLAPGQYIIMVVSQSRTAGLVRADVLKNASEENHAATYYPSATEPAQATPVSVSAGSDLRGMDIRMIKTRTYHLRGKVIDAATNLPVRDVFLNLMPAYGNGMFERGRNGSVVRNAAGTFDIASVLPGSYVLMINGMNGGGRVSAQQLVDVANENINDLIVIAGPPLQLSGSVTVDGNESVDFSLMRFYLEPVIGLSINNLMIQPKPDGTFTVANVSSVKLRLQVMNMPESTYFKSVRMGVQETAGSVIDLSGGVGGPVEIVISAKGGQIKGTVKDAKQEPAASALVVLVPDSSRRDQLHLFKQTPADQNGSFSLKGVPPGEYTLFSWESIEDGAWQDPAVLLKYEIDGTKVKVAQGGSETVQVKMISVADTK